MPCPVITRKMSCFTSRPSIRGRHNTRNSCCIDLLDHLSLFFGGVQTKMSWRSLLTLQYSR